MVNKWIFIATKYCWFSNQVEQKNLPDELVDHFIGGMDGKRINTDGAKLRGKEAE